MSVPHVHRTPSHQTPGHPTPDRDLADRRTTPDQVFSVWCRLTGTDPATFGPDERDAFDARPQLAGLLRVPYEVLLDAGIGVARRGSLPLERWLHAVEVVRPETRSTGQRGGEPTRIDPSRTAEPHAIGA